MLPREELHQLRLALLAVIVVVLGFAMCGSTGEAARAAERAPMGEQAP